jgi:hypothetical protein
VTALGGFVVAMCVLCSRSDPDVMGWKCSTRENVYCAAVLRKSIALSLRWMKWSMEY